MTPGQGTQVSVCKHGIEQVYKDINAKNGQVVAGCISKLEYLSPLHGEKGFLDFAGHIYKLMKDCQHKTLASYIPNSCLEERIQMYQIPTGS